MANFKVHLGTAAVLGTAYGGVAAWRLGMEWGPAVLAAGLTAVGGLLPDLDSDASVPNRTLFRLAGAATAVLAFFHLLSTSYSIGQSAVLLAGSYLAVRYLLAQLFRRVTVHRGMFHSIPALLIAGLALFLLYAHHELRVRLFLAGGIMLGYLSHLVLDELWAVDFQGVRLRKPFGTALKLASPSWPATTFAYFLLFSLTLLALRSV